MQSESKSEGRGRTWLSTQCNTVSLSYWIFLHTLVLSSIFNLVLFFSILIILISCFTDSDVQSNSGAEPEMSKTVSLQLEVSEDGSAL